MKSAKNFRWSGAIYFMSSCGFTAIFALAMVFTLPIQWMSKQFFKIMFTSSVIMIVALIIEPLVKPVPKWNRWICFISVIGVICYCYSSLKYENINKGTGYLTGAFLISFAYGLRILSILVQNGKKVAQICQIQKYRIIQFGCIVMGSILFFMSSAVLLLGNNRRWTATGLNILAGILICTSGVILLRRTNVDEQYSAFKQETELANMS